MPRQNRDSILWPARVDVVRFRPETPFRDFAANLPLGADEVFRRFDPRLSPWVLAVGEWFASDDVERVYLVQGSQTSKTTTMLALLLWAATQRPGPIMWVGAGEDDVVDFVAQRLKPHVLSVGARTSQRKMDWKKTNLRVGDTWLRAAWATSAIRLRSWPCRYVFGDEVGVWPRELTEVGEPLEYVWRRTRMYEGRGRKGVFATTPRDADTPVWLYAMAAAVYQWWVPCLGCGSLQFLDVSRLREIEGEVAYVCECGHVHREADKIRMLERGALQRVNPDTWAAASDTPSSRGRDRTLHLPATYSVFTPWATLFRQLRRLESDEALRRVYWTDELALPYRPPSESPAGVDDLKKLIVEGLPRDTLPGDSVGVTCGVDVQADRIYYVIRAWRRDESSRLLRAGVLPRGVGAKAFAYFSDMLHRLPYDVDQVFVDAGYDTGEVYRYCCAPSVTQREWGYTIAPAKGEGLKLDASGAVRGRARQRPVWRVEFRPFASGDVFYLYYINTDWAKQWLLSRWKIAPGDPGAWELPGELPEDYIRQLANEERVCVRGRWAWRERSAVVGSHYLDCEVLARAAAWYPVAVHLSEEPPPGATAGEIATGADVVPRRARYGVVGSIVEEM